MHAKSNPCHICRQACIFIRLVAIGFTLSGLSALGAEIDGIFQRNIARTGEFADVTFPRAPKVLWKFSPTETNRRMAPGLGGILAHGGVLYSSDLGGKLYALDQQDGSVKWMHSLGQVGRSEPPLVAGDTACFATATGLVALSRETGAVLWTFPIAEGADETSPLLVDTTLFVCGYDGVVYAIDTTNGSIKWQQSVLDDVPPAPPGFDGKRARLDGKPARPRIPASDGQLLFQPIFDQSRVVALDCATGAIKWSFQAGGWIYGNPTVTGNFLLVGSQDGQLNCIDKNTGQVVWKFAAATRIEAPAAVFGDGVYFGACNGDIYRANLADGAKRWLFQCDPYANGRRSAFYATPIVANNLLCIGAMEGQMYLLDLEEGRLQWKFRPSEKSEIVNITAEGKRLFVSTRPTLDAEGEAALFAIGESH